MITITSPATCDVCNEAFVSVCGECADYGDCCYDCAEAFEYAHCMCY